MFADGVGSTARAALLPDVRPPMPGYVAWRGVVPETQSRARRPEIVLDDAITYYVYANSHVLVYPIPGRDGSVAPGERLINIVWYRNYLAGDDLDDLLIDTPRQPREMSRCRPVRCAPSTSPRRVPWRRPGCPLPIAEVVLAIDDMFVQVVLDLDVPRMAFGRACLLGDAAFVVRPHAAAGTAKAAEDAWTLRDALAAHPRRSGGGAGRVGARSARPRSAACRRGRARSGDVRRSTARGGRVIRN